MKCIVDKLHAILYNIIMIKPNDNPNSGRQINCKICLQPEWIFRGKSGCANRNCTEFAMQAVDDFYNSYLSGVIHSIKTLKVPKQPNNQGTPKYLTCAIDNAFDEHNANPGEYVEDAIYAHVKDFLAQKFSVAILTAKDDSMEMALQELFEAIISE